MSTHSVAEAKNQLSKLINRALDGEGIVNTRRGQPVIEFKPVRPSPRPMTQTDIDWLRASRVGRTMPKTDAGVLVSKMRDEGEKLGIYLDASVPVALFVTQHRSHSTGPWRRAPARSAWRLRRLEGLPAALGTSMLPLELAP